MSQKIISPDQLASSQLPDRALEYLRKSRDEIVQGVSSQRFSALFSMASRYARRELLNAPEPAAGVQLGHWNQLELLRVALLLSRQDLAEQSFAMDFEAMFRFADEGETCALYRAIPFLPGPERFLWRASEGCRSNMRTVFDAVALDSPYPQQYFDGTAWNQLVMKAIFIETDIERILGLDERLSPELTRMALDFAAERQSAGRGLIPGFWLTLGPYHPDALSELVKNRWADVSTSERAVMIMALGRAGAESALADLANQYPDDLPKQALELVAQGETGQANLGRFTQIHTTM